MSYCLGMVVILSFAVAAQDVESALNAEEKIEQLIDDLESDTFAQRQAASKTLQEMGRDVIPSLKEALRSVSPDARMIIKGILASLEKTLEQASVTSSTQLSYVNAVRISPNNRFVYATAWKTGRIGVFELDVESAKLKAINYLGDDSTRGAIGISFCKARPWVAVSCYGSRSIQLFRSDFETGALKRVDVFAGDALSPTPVFPVGSVFSRDGRWLFVADASIRFGKQHGGVLIFEVSPEGKLRWVDTFVGDEENQLGNVRGLSIAPDRDELCITSERTGTLTIASFDNSTGLIKTEQILRDEQDGVMGISGVMKAAYSPNGSLIYTTSGRFRGDSGVSVFQRVDDGPQFRVVQELINGRDDLNGFLGGNDIVVAPDGRNVYVSGARSGQVIGFEADPQTCKLTYIETAVSTNTNPGPAGMTISDDGKFLISTIEKAGALIVMRRRTSASR
ncbi:MAG: beta-propeller fold lactonase family protein [Planctomycetota bacterium]